VSLISPALTEMFVGGPRESGSDGRRSVDVVRTNLHDDDDDDSGDDVSSENLGNAHNTTTQQLAGSSDLRLTSLSPRRESSQHPAINGA